MLGCCWPESIAASCLPAGSRAVARCLRAVLADLQSMSCTVFDASDATARCASLRPRPASARRHKGACSSSQVARAASAGKVRAEDWAFAAARNGYPLSAMGVGRPPPTGMECLCRPLVPSGVASDGRPTRRPGTIPRPHEAREARAPERRTPRHAAPAATAVGVAAKVTTAVGVSRRTGAPAVASTADAPPASPVVVPLTPHERALALVEPHAQQQARVRVRVGVRVRVRVRVEVRVRFGVRVRVRVRVRAN